MKKFCLVESLSTLDQGISLETRLVVIFFYSLVRERTCQRRECSSDKDVKESSLFILYQNGKLLVFLLNFGNFQISMTLVLFFLQVFTNWYLELVGCFLCSNEKYSWNI